MPRLRSQLDLDRCPHCGIDRPTLNKQAEFITRDYTEQNQRLWRSYACSRCGGVVTGGAKGGWDSEVLEMYPSSAAPDEAIPDRARNYLVQALDSLAAPSGAIMLAASAVDAMLKAKEFRTGSLYQRIDAAAEQHFITPEMARWAHDVRLDANDERHADDAAPLPVTADARRTIDFALALAQFLFVLPTRVRRGIADATRKNQ